MNIKELCLILCVCLLINGCSTSIQPNQVKMPSVTSTIVDTATATSTSTPLPPTPTPQPTFPIISPPEAWYLIDPQKADAPDLIIPDVKNYMLDPTWKPTQLVFSQKRGSLLDAGYAYHIVIYKNDQYYKDQEVLSAELVSDLLYSIDHLHPTQFLLAGNAWTDDYPNWTVGLSDDEGNQITIISSSTGNPGNGPWSLVYNGRIYTQYDGSLSEPLFALFQVESGKQGASYSPGGNPAGTINFATNGWPTQFIYNYSGLYSLGNSFDYYPDLENKSLSGSIVGQTTGMFGEGIVGTITELSKISLTLAADTKVNCEIKPDEDSNPTIVEWIFHCPIENVQSGGSFDFPIEISYVTIDKKHLNSVGRLFGIWRNNNSQMLIPLPDELLKIFSDNQDFQEILASHFAYAEYKAQINPDHPMNGNYVGNIRFLGETTYKGQPLRYTISTPFAVENGKIIYWTLTKESITDMLTQIGNLPLTKQMINTNPEVVLNMWYTKPGQLPDQKISLINDVDFLDSITRTSCGKIPGFSVPSNSQPLEAFGYNVGWNSYDAEFVLINGQPIVLRYYLEPDDDMNGAIDRLLIPDGLDTGTYPAFDTLEINSGNIINKTRFLKLMIKHGLTKEAVEFYNQLIGAVPENGDIKYGAYWHITDVAFTVNQDGKIEIVSCSTP